MKKQVRLGVSIALLVLSLVCFFGNVLQFQFKDGLKNTLMGNVAEMAAEIAGDEEILDENYSPKEAIDTIVEALDDKEVGEVMDATFGKTGVDSEEILGDIKSVMKAMRDSGVSYVEMSKFMDFVMKYDSVFNLDDAEKATANGIKVFCYVMLGLAVLWAALAALLALKNKTAGFVLYFIHAILNLAVSALGKYLFETIDDDVVTVQAMAPVLSVVLALVALVFWCSTKKKVVEETSGMNEETI